MEILPGGGCRESSEVQRIEGKGLDDVCADTGSGGSCKANDRGRCVGGPEVGKVGVGGAEIMTPFTDAWSGSQQ